MFSQRGGLMSRGSSIAAAAAVSLLMGISARGATIFNSGGNGESGFGGVLGTGTIQIDNDASGALDFTFTKGSSDFNDAVVIYIQAGASGFSSTANFTDDADPLRSAISGYRSGTTPLRSVLNFNGTNGMTPNYAVALDTAFGGLWQLAENASLPFVKSVGLNPTGSATASAYTFSFNVSDIGLTPNSGESFKFYATYLNSGNVFRSNEAFGGGFGESNPGYASVTMSNALTVVSVPEPAMAPLVIFGLLVPAAVSYRRVRRRALRG
jgi:hypothetical protein